MTTTSTLRPPPLPTDQPADKARAGGPARIWLREQIEPLRPAIRHIALLGVAHGWLAIPQAGLIAALIAGLLIPAALRSRTEAHALPDWISTEWLASWGLPALLAVIVLRAGIGWWRQRQAAELTRRLRSTVRRRVAAHVYALGPLGSAQFHSGQLASALLDQIDALGPYASRYLPQSRQALWVPIGLLIAVVLLDWLAALLLLLAASLIPFCMALIGRSAAGVSRAQFQALARLGNQFLDRLQGLAVLKHHGRGEAATADIERAADEYRERTMAVLRVAFLSSAVLELISAAAIATLAIYIGLGLLGLQPWGPASALTLCSGLFVLLLTPDFFQPLRELGQHYHDRAAAIGAADALQPLLATPLGMAARNGSLGAPQQAPEIHYVGVNAQYADGRRALSAPLDWRAPAGRTSLLIGPSGAGKSSLLALVAGFLACSEGQLLIDGRPAEDYAAGALEQRMAWLGQNPQLLPGTLRENLLLADPQASEQRLLAAAGQAGVLQFAHGLPEGLDTVVGERGFGLSGGEAQRVALARALIRRPRLLLLDEPTARLDPESRDWVLNALRTAARSGCTVLIATHQPEWFEWADERLRLDRSAHG
jgi:ATP-binding cassette, subfamily C, bacterial CydD